MYARCGTTKTSGRPPLAALIDDTGRLTEAPGPCGAQSPASTRATAVLPTPLLPVIMRCSPSLIKNERSLTSGADRFESSRASSVSPCEAGMGMHTSTWDSPIALSASVSVSGKGGRLWSVERRVYIRVVKPDVIHVSRGMKESYE